MSADYWGVCPQCWKNHKVEIENLETVLEDQYGKLPREVYKRHEANLIALKGKTEEDFRTLPTYYEFYMKDGKLHADWSATCRTCEWSAEAKFEKDLEIETEFA